MQAIAQLLGKLFNVASKVGVQTGRGLISHATGKVGVNAVRRLNLNVGGTRVSYQHLAKTEQQAVDELVEYAARFLWAYIDHHDENTPNRLRARSIDELLWAHAEEFFEAGKNAFFSRARSHSYDYLAGKPNRTSIIQDDDVVKQLILAMIQEFHDETWQEAQKVECGYCGYVGTFAVPGNCPSCRHVLRQIVKRA